MENEWDGKRVTAERVTSEEKFVARIQSANSASGRRLSSEFSDKHRRTVNGEDLYASSPDAIAARILHVP